MNHSPQKGFFTPTSKKGVFLNFDGHQYKLQFRAKPSKKPYIKSRTTVHWTCRFATKCTAKIATVSEADPTIEVPVNKPHTCRPIETPEDLGSAVTINVHQSENSVIRFRGYNFIQVQGSQQEWICRCFGDTSVDEVNRCRATITTQSVHDLTVVRKGKFLVWMPDV